MTCPSSTPLSFIDLSACCVHTLRPITFISIIFLKSSGETSAENKSELVFWKQLLRRYLGASTVIGLLTYFASPCEEVLYAALRGICATGSNQHGSQSLVTANKAKWFHKSFFWKAYRFLALFSVRFIMLVRLSAWKNSAPKWCIFMKFGI